MWWASVVFSCLNCVVALAYEYRIYACGKTQNAYSSRAWQSWTRATRSFSLGLAKKIHGNQYDLQMVEQVRFPQRFLHTIAVEHLSNFVGVSTRLP